MQRKTSEAFGKPHVGTGFDLGSVMVTA